jgi:hypothetical protein
MRCLDVDGNGATGLALSFAPLRQPQAAYWYT